MSGAELVRLGGGGGRVYAMSDESCCGATITAYSRMVEVRVSRHDSRERCLARMPEARQAQYRQCIQFAQGIGASRSSKVLGTYMDNVFVQVMR